MQKVLAAALLVVVYFAGFVAPAWADEAADSVFYPVRIIRYNTGGDIDTFAQDYVRADKDGQVIVVDGPCMSACTLVLPLVNPSHVCATKRGAFGFHSAWRADPDDSDKRNFAADATEMVWKLYPQSVQDYLAAHGWKGGEHPDMVWAPAQEFVQSCDAMDKSVLTYTWQPRN